MLIGAGAVLPWVDKELPVKVYVLGMQTGLERVWVRRLLVVAGVGVLVHVGRFVTPDRRPGLDALLVGVGGLTAAIAAVTSPLAGRWAPGPGVYVTLVGSLLVALGSGITFVTPLLDGDSRSLRDARD